MFSLKEDTLPRYYRPSKEEIGTYIVVSSASLKAHSGKHFAVCV